MKLILLLLFSILTCALVANGQVGIIKDTDGFTNIHAGRSVTSRVIGKFHDGDVFGYGDEQNGWINVFYFPADSSGSKYLEGYIYKDRVLPIDHLRLLPGIRKALSNDHVTMHNDSVTVELQTTPFRAKQHMLLKDSTGLVQKIDGKRPLGTDGEMPIEKLISLRMLYKGQPVDIPAAAWDNLYDPTLETCNIFIDNRTGFIYVYLLSGRSAAGGYEVVWVFKNGRFIKRYVDQSNN